ncbi:uncharacterized protein LOC115624576 [Scaptodrosophila lebanonensis]|uniref:Uncharacterized protein LOC115624576 n=1 Tax=Drosophila lebanonensis TaxID=7225 RepID=A0A6J2TIA3_DROLE|nr:uncharacterized protein LOC115624576 [Scaptodrosophila lebanonensis]
MAIQANRRKRKHETADGIDDGEGAVPKKQMKQFHTPKKEKAELGEAEQEQADSGLADVDEVDTNHSPKKKSKKAKAATSVEAAKNVDGGQQVELQTPTKKSKRKHGQKNEGSFEAMELTENGYLHENLDSGTGYEEEPKVRFPNDFKMMHFRSRLRTKNFITELRHFLYMCDTRPKIVAKYIEKRGKPLELAEAFERIDKSNVLHLSYLCEALQRVVMEILVNQKSHMESAAHGCRYFLKAHGAVVEQLLQSANPKHRRNALKLLTAIVCVEPQLGRQVLSSYDTLSNTKTGTHLLSHSRSDCNEEDTVRKAYIHFVLAFLVDGNTLLIRNILDKGHLITLLAGGLLYDDHVTVCVVLNALRQYVLECPEISKTKKILVFDAECCKHLRRLYDWLGPKALISHFSGKRINNSELMQLAAPEEREAVATATHSLLLMLFTSRKHGIAFDAVTHYRQKHNSLQGKMIGTLHRPYENWRKIELITETLRACPELARHTVRNYASLLSPTNATMSNLTHAAELLTKIIQSVPPEAIAPAMQKMTLTDLSYWIKEVCLPIEALLITVSQQILRHKDYCVRIAVNRLLLAMMTQYSNYISAIARREKSKHAINSLRRFKFELLNHVLVNFPTVESILFSLSISINDQLVESVNVLEHLSVTLDLVLLMCKENRAFVNRTSKILDYLDVLRPLYELDFDDLKKGVTKEMQVKNDTQPLSKQLDIVSKMKLEIKSIKTILLLFPGTLQPQEQLFEKVLRSFVRAYLLQDSELSAEAGNVLHRLFYNTGIFDSCRYEIDLWLEALHGFDSEIVDNVLSILLNVFRLDFSVVELPEIIVRETASNVENLEQLFKQIEEGQTVQAYVETLTLSKLMPLILQGVSIEPPYDAYFELVFVLLYHYHTKPEQVQQLYSQHLQIHNNYMQSWLQLESAQSQPEMLDASVVKQWPLMANLQEALFSAESPKFESLFKPAKNNSLQFKLKLENGEIVHLHHSLENTSRIMLYVQVLLFHVAQLMAKQQLSFKISEQAALYMKRLLQIAAQLDLNKPETHENEEEQQTHVQRLLHYIYGVRLSQMQLTKLFSSENNDQLLHYVHFLRLLTEHCRTLPNFASYTGNYRLKVVNALDIALSTRKEVGEEAIQLLECVELVKVFELNAEECMQMLALLTSKLQSADYFVHAKATHYYELLLHLLKRLAALQQPVDCREIMTKLRLYYADYCGELSGLVGEQQLEQLEVALCDFLLHYHHHIADCDAEFFGCFFGAARKLSKSAVRLASLLLQRNENLAPKFSTLLLEHVEQKELIYPLLDVAFSCKYTLETNLLQRCYQVYKSGLLKSIEKPQKAALIYRENAEASAALIANCMPKSECVDYCNKQLKFDAVELYQMRVLHEIYKQAFEASAKNVKQQSAIFVNYISIQVQMLSLDLKKQMVQLEKLEQLAYNCYEWWQQMRSEEMQQALDWSRLLNSPQWVNFCKSCLKMALAKEEQAADEARDITNGLLLKLLAYLCEHLYEDFSESREQQENTSTPALLYEMVCTHSCCLDHLLDYASTPTAVKTHVLQLLETLARKAPQALQSAHIPILLGAYQARLTHADRFTLALLEHYERYDVGLAAYRPFIWGESAEAFYALRATEDERSKLQKQETAVAQVMSLIVPQQCKYTIENYPVWRALHSSEQLPEVEFVHPQKKALRFGNNTLEHQVEQGQLEFEQSVRRLCPKRSDVFESCYDPAFIVPLMVHCFAPDSVVRSLWPVQNGLLALSFCALSSLDKDMRLAAACCQQRYRVHFEQAKFFEKPLWTQAYDNIQAGLNDLRESWLAQRRTHGGTPRVPLIPALFIARTFNLSTDPTHLLYKRLMMYLQLKESFNFQTIPEFNVFFYSQEVEHQQYREWIVDLLRSGIKCSGDLFLLVSTNTFKVLLSYFSCNLSGLEVNLLILSLLSTCAKIPGAVKIMLEHVGILAWLAGVIRETEFYHFDIIEGLITIACNLWFSMAANRTELLDYSNLQIRLHRVMLSFLPLLSARISVAALARLLNVLQKTSAVSGQYMALSEKQLDLLIDCAARHWPEQISGVRYVRSFGGAGASKREEYCRWLANEQQLDTHGVLALSSLRSYVSDWWQAHNNPNRGLQTLNDGKGEAQPQENQKVQQQEATKELQ